MANIFSKLLSVFKKTSSEEEQESQNNHSVADGTVSDKWLVPVWEGQFEATFTYCGKNSGRLRRTVSVSSIRQDLRGELYFRGFCQTRNEERSFNTNNIKTKLTVNGKKYDVEDYLRTACGIDPVVVHPQVQLRRDEEKARCDDEKAKVRARLPTVWTGEESIYFRYVENENGEPYKVSITLNEVAVSRTGIVFLIMETPERLYVYDSRNLDSDIYYSNSYVDLYAFLIQVLHLSNKECGLNTIWSGNKKISITYSSTFSGAKKEATTLEAVVKNCENTVFFVVKSSEQNYYKFIQACDISSIYEDEQRCGPKKFLEERLDLYGVFDRA